MRIERKSLTETIMFESMARLSLEGIPAHAEVIIPQLLAEAGKQGLTITGPCIFAYEGCDGRPDTEFTLRIGFPVDRESDPGPFSCRRIPAHDCLATLYQGPISGIGEAWGRFTPAALAQDLALQSVGREVYVQWIDPHSQDNLVELQIPLGQ